MEKLFKIFGTLFQRLAREANCSASSFLVNIGVFELKEVNWLSFYINGFKIKYSDYYPTTLPAFLAWLFWAWSFARLLLGITAHIPKVAFLGLFLDFWLICQRSLIHSPQKSDLLRHSSHSVKELFHLILLYSTFNGILARMCLSLSSWSGSNQIYSSKYWVKLWFCSLLDYNFKLY